MADAEFVWIRDSEAQLQRWAPAWVAIGFLYLPAVFGLQKVARHIPGSVRRAVRLAWGVWNLLTALFSTAGFLMVFHDGIKTLWNFQDLCSADYLQQHSIIMDGTTGRWVFYFIVSKMAELADSVFLAVLLKPINFLHWYHHLSIYVYMFLAGLQWHPHMLTGVAWNYGVHGVMYLYYACACFGLQWPRALARSITVLQVIQMLCQSVVAVASLGACGAVSIGQYPGLAMYAVYLVLFLEFFVGRYSNKKLKGA